MSEFEFVACTADALSQAKAAYRASLAAPLDGMWEAFTMAADHYEIRLHGQSLGHCAVNADKKLLQFSTYTNMDARALFAAAIRELGMSGAVVSTCEPAALALALDHQISVSVNALMYRFPDDATPKTPTFPDGTVFGVIDAARLPDAIAFAADTLGASKNWLQAYFGDLVSRGELYGLWTDDDLIATGECRPSPTQKPYADVGMIVGLDQRRKRLATNILRQLVALCIERELQAICSTEAGNKGAQRAISNAGFICDHRILTIGF